jgi:hypothetical protein
LGFHSSKMTRYNLQQYVDFLDIIHPSKIALLNFKSWRRLGARVITAKRTLLCWRVGYTQKNGPA